MLCFCTWKAFAMFRSFLLQGTTVCVIFSTVLSGKNTNYIWGKEINPLNLPSGARSVINPIDTSFSCSGRPYGYYVDVLNNCQIFHVCDPNTKQIFSFFCPKYTAFDPVVSVCTYRGIKTCDKIINYNKDHVNRDSDSTGTAIIGGSSGDSSQDSGTTKGSNVITDTKGISSDGRSQNSDSESFVTDNGGEDFSSEDFATDDSDKSFGSKGDSDLDGNFATPRYVRVPTEAPPLDDNPLNLPSGVNTINKNIDTSFSCFGRIYGYYADVLNECKIFHVCDSNSNRKFSFFCPQHTVFDQATLVCTYPGWGVPCHKAVDYYHVNEKFGKVSPRADIGNQQPDILRCPYPLNPWTVFPNSLENPNGLSLIEVSTIKLDHESELTTSKGDDERELDTTKSEDSRQFNIQHVIEK